MKILSEWGETMYNFLYHLFDNAIFNSILGFLGAAFLAGYLGFRQYRKQKNYEIIQKRYIQEIENFLSYVHSIRIRSENNFSHTLRVLRKFKDLKPAQFLQWLNEVEMDDDLGEKGVKAHMPSSLFTFAYLFGLNGNHKFMQDCVDIGIKSSDANNFFADAPSILKQEINENDDLDINDAKRKEIADNLFKRITAKNKELITVYGPIGKLENILFKLRKMEIDNYKQIESLKNDQEFIDILKEK